jgi:uncharacterized membrane protein YfcA
MIPYLFLLGLFAGALSGLLGIGGGVIIVPALILAFGVSSHQAIGTSIAVIVPTAIVGLIKHYSTGHVNLYWTMCIAIGGILGAFIGASLTEHLSGVNLKRIFGVMLIIIGLSMVIGKDFFNKSTNSKISTITNTNSSEV